MKLQLLLMFSTFAVKIVCERELKMEHWVRNNCMNRHKFKRLFWQQAIDNSPAP